MAPRRRRNGGGDGGGAAAVAAAATADVDLRQVLAGATYESAPGTPIGDIIHQVRTRLERFGFCIWKQALAGAQGLAADQAEAQQQQRLQVAEVLRIAAISRQACCLIGHDTADAEPDDYRLSLGLDVLREASEKSKLARSFVELHTAAVELGVQALGYYGCNEMVILSFPGGEKQVGGRGKSARFLLLLLHTHTLSSLHAAALLVHAHRQ